MKNPSLNKSYRFKEQHGGSFVSELTTCLGGAWAWVADKEITWKIVSISYDVVTLRPARRSWTAQTLDSFDHRISLQGFREMFEEVPEELKYDIKVGDTIKIMTLRWDGALLVYVVRAITDIEGGDPVVTLQVKNDTRCVALTMTEVQEQLGTDRWEHNLKKA